MLRDGKNVRKLQINSLSWEKKSILWDTLAPAYLETCMLAKQHVHIERNGKNIEYGENKTK